MMLFMLHASHCIDHVHATNLCPEIAQKKVVSEAMDSNL